MKKCLLLFFLCLCFLPGHVSAQRIYQMEQFQRWYSQYYQKPEPINIPDAILFFVESNLATYETAKPQFAYFIGTIVRNDSYMMQQTYDMLSLKGNQDARMFYLNALWFADTEASRELIKEAETDWLTIDVLETAQWLRKNPSFKPFEQSARDPGHIDILWGHFFATGDAAAIQAVIQALALFESPNETYQTTANFAQWSLTSMGKKNSDVLQICDKSLAEAEGIIKTKLQDILSSALKE
ncbi:MAG: hypothetical protein K8S27_00185 [Candidatus Omnitrophica bacterium]|nr:hypothetical protein [Candidatus Omnitrophota bacterium]